MKPEKIESLRRGFDTLLSDASLKARVEKDPVSIPAGFRHRDDIEVVAFLTASFSYGRADVFRVFVESLIAPLGSRPAKRLIHCSNDALVKIAKNRVYRFNNAADIALLLTGVRNTLLEYGSLENAFTHHLDASKKNIRHSLISLGVSIRDASEQQFVAKKLGQPRALHHLLPAENSQGALKRWVMFLRWMIRKNDISDLGIWNCLSPAELFIPLDAHVSRLATYLRMTKRKSANWQMTQDVTHIARQIYPDDPVRIDFALCHLGMSGRCPIKPRLENCRACPLNANCSIGVRQLQAGRRAGA